MDTIRILVIEDHVDGALTLQALLQLLGYDAAVAFTGTAGVQLALDWNPDVVLSDIDLPGLSGYGVARRLRRNPGTRNSLLIAVSAYDGVRDMKRGKDAGFDYYFIKPLDPEVLALLLSRFRDKRRTG
jgi:CheY-like chemotaxis protein